MEETKTNKAGERTVWFDYDNQAWVENGVYVRCGHPEHMSCGCYGRTHEGQFAPLQQQDYFSRKELIDLCNRIYAAQPNP